MSDQENRGISSAAKVAQGANAIATILNGAVTGGLLCAGHNRISVAFQPTQMEYDMITTSRADLEVQMQKNEQAARG